MFKCLSTLNPGDVMAKKYIQNIFSYTQFFFLLKTQLKTFILVFNLRSSELFI